MKKALSIILILTLTFCLCACGEQASVSEKVGDKDAFLKAMATGITNRLNDDRDKDSMTREEIANYYETLVDYELKEIKPFENCRFEDAFFDALAHEYINACKTQKTANEKFKNDSFYDALWNGGRSVRAGIIVYLYENYDLPISADEADSYKDNVSSGTSSYVSVEGDYYDVASGLTFNYDNMVTEKAVTIDSGSRKTLYNKNKIEITLSDIDVDHQQFNFSVKNNSDSSVTCFFSKSKLNNHQISARSTWGYDFTRSGLIGTSFSMFDKEELTKANMKPSDYIDTSLYIVKTDGTTAYVLSEVPVRISCSVF